MAGAQTASVQKEPRRQDWLGKSSLNDTGLEAGSSQLTEAQRSESKAPFFNAAQAAMGNAAIVRRMAPLSEGAQRHPPAPLNTPDGMAAAQAALGNAAIARRMGRRPKAAPESPTEVAGKASEPTPKVQAPAQGVSAKPQGNEPIKASSLDGGAKARVEETKSRVPSKVPAAASTTRRAPAVRAPAGKAALPGAAQATASRQSASVPESEGTHAGGGASSANADPGFKSVKAQIALAATHISAHPPAARKAEEAHDAAQGPSNDVESQAEARHMGELAQEQPAPFGREAFKAALRQKIADAAPQNLEEAANFKSNNKLGEVKAEVSGAVKHGAEQSSGEIQKKNEQPPNQSGLAPKPVTPLPPADAGKAPIITGAARAAPKPKAEAAINVQDGPAQISQRMAEASVTEPQLQESNEPKFQSAVAAKHQAQENANATPGLYRQTEQPALAGAQAHAETAVQGQLQAMHGEKAATLAGVLSNQGGAKGQDEAARAQVTGRIEQIFQACKGKVEARLAKLDADVNAAFDQGAEAARQGFEAYVGQHMDAYKEERYSGLEGKGRWIKDKLLGMPAEVNAFYTEGKRRYLGAMDAVVDGVATLVETGLREATAEVSLGKREVDTYVKSLPASLQKIGKEAQSQVQAKFDELSQSITDKQSALVDSLAQKWSDETQKLDSRLEQLKAANRGLVDKALDAMGDVISTIKQLGEMLRSVLARAAGVVDKILRDPIGFVGNLVAGAKAGFQRFVSNVERHLQQGLIGWLTGALGSAGIQLPEKFDLKGIFSLVVQVLGLTWQSVRPRAVRLLGEKAVAALEEASEIVKALVTGSFGAVWEHIKETVGDLKAAVLDQIKSFVVTKVITAGVTWILSLLNPASAFIKACKAIYDIVMFFVERAAQISDLVSAVLDSIEAVVGGAIGTMASKIEGALARALPVAIGFLASLLGIGGISETVKKVIQKVKAPIEKAIDWVLQKAVALARRAGKWLKGKLTGNGKEAGNKGKDAEDEVHAPKSLVPTAPVRIDLPDSTHKEAFRHCRDGQVIYGSAGGDPKSATVRLLKQHKDAHYDANSGALTLPAVNRQSIEGAGSLQEIGAAVAHQTGVTNVFVRRLDGELLLEAQINPFACVGKFTFDDLTPFEGEKILLLGEANFSFARSLADKLKSKNLIATSYEKTPGTFEHKGKTKKYQGAKENIEAAKRDGAQIVPGVDAQHIDPNLGGPPSHFQYIVFNFPMRIVERQKMINENKVMIAAFLRSAAKALRPGGKVYLSSKESWLRLWGLPEAAATAGLTLETKLDKRSTVVAKEFEAGEFPGYRHRQTHQDDTADGTEKGLTIVFRKP